jgi:hypothetical protein
MRHLPKSRMYARILEQIFLDEPSPEGSSHALERSCGYWQLGAKEHMQLQLFCIANANGLPSSLLSLLAILAGFGIVGTVSSPFGAGVVPVECGAGTLPATADFLSPSLPDRPLHPRCTSILTPARASAS